MAPKWLELLVELSSRVSCAYCPPRICFASRPAVLGGTGNGMTEDFLGKGDGTDFKVGVRILGVKLLDPKRRVLLLWLPPNRTPPRAASAPSSGTNPTTNAASIAITMRIVLSMVLAETFVCVALTGFSPLCTTTPMTASS